MNVLDIWSSDNEGEGGSIYGKRIAEQRLGLLKKLKRRRKKLRDMGSQRKKNLNQKKKKQRNRKKMRKERKRKNC